MVGAGSSCWLQTHTFSALGLASIHSLHLLLYQFNVSIPDCFKCVRSSAAFTMYWKSAKYSSAEADMWSNSTKAFKNIVNL